MCQTELVIGELKKVLNIDIVPKIIKTEGDLDQDLSLRNTTGEGVFVRELETALLQGDIDLAVHSLKDLPAEETPGLKLAAYLKRDDPREAFLSVSYNSFDELPDRSIIGTSSLRRIIQLQKIKPSCEFKDIRGNIETRLRKMEEGQYEGMILAMAGLIRLKLTHYVRQIFSTLHCLPAPGQGVVSIQIREDFCNQNVIQALRGLNDKPTELAVKAERGFVKKLGGSCRLPVGALATVAGNSLMIFGMVANSNGERILYHQKAGVTDQPELLGNRMADWFLKKGIIDWM